MNSKALNPPGSQQALRVWYAEIRRAPEVSPAMQVAGLPAAGLALRLKTLCIEDGTFRQGRWLEPLVERLIGPFHYV